MKAIIGLDLSLRATGICTLEEPNPGTALRAGPEHDARLIEAKGKTGVERMDDLTLRVVEECAGALLVVVEGFSFASNGAMAREIAGLGWCVRVGLYRSGIPYIDVPPSQLKKWVTGKGNADKNVMLKEVWKRWDFDTNDDNLADAYALARLGRCVLGLEKATTEFQHQVLADVQAKNAALLQRVVKAAKEAA